MGEPGVFTGNARAVSNRFSPEADVAAAMYEISELAERGDPWARRMAAHFAAAGERRMLNWRHPITSRPESYGEWEASPLCIWLSGVGSAGEGTSCKGSM